MISKRERLINFFKKRRGLATYSDIIHTGFNKSDLKVLLHLKQIQKIDRALYKLTMSTSLSNPDLIMVSMKSPKGVICLLSALAFHEVTSEIPRLIDLAIPQGNHANKINYPPVHYYHFSKETWNAGIVEQEIDGYKVKVYNVAKTVADCFKFRNKIGINIARDALKTAVLEKGISPKEIMFYADICRVANIIKPLLETIL